jgi:hypothetical protein
MISRLLRPLRHRLASTLGAPGSCPLAATALATVLLAACSSSPDPRAPAPAPTASSAAPTPAEGSTTAIRLRIGDTAIQARLNDTATARDLLTQLPLTLTFRDFNGVEKIAPLPRALSIEGVPAGDSGRPLDLGYYSPTGDLVIYDGDVGYYRGIVRIGRYEADPATVRDRPDGFAATVERAP